MSNLVYPCYDSMQCQSTLIRQINMPSATRTAPAKAAKRHATQSGSTDSSTQYLSSAEVIGLLRIKPQTLYAYVSRGLIRSIRQAKRRGHMYLREDVERIRAQGQARAGGGPLYKGGSPRWSEPIVHTSITRISEQGPAYRGRPAVELAQAGIRFENVAELIWSGVWQEEPVTWDFELPFGPILEMLALARRQSPDPVAMYSLTVAALASCEAASDDLREGTTILCARRLLGILSGAAPFRHVSKRPARPTPHASIADCAASVLGAARRPESTHAINFALVLLADHDLTPQTFAARLAASSGASLYNCLGSALSVHSSSRSRRSCDRVESLLLGSRDRGHFLQQLATLLRAGGHPPGFDHPLYPGGDRRATVLLQLAREQAKTLRTTSNAVAERLNWIEEATQMVGVKPGVEAGLVALCFALGLPRSSATHLFTLARCAGWIGHVIEQRTAGLMLRPKARYRG